MWYALYDVVFDGTWTYVHEDKDAGTLRIGYAFPVPDAAYDDFQFHVDDRDLAATLRPDKGKIVASVDVTPGRTVVLHVHYKMRGLNSWDNQGAQGNVASLQNSR